MGFFDELLITLKRSRKDTSDCLQDLEASIDAFARNERHVEQILEGNDVLLFCFFTSLVKLEQRKNWQVRRFLNRDNFTLFRSRLDDATGTLSVVSAVTKYSLIPY